MEPAHALPLSLRRTDEERARMLVAPGRALDSISSGTPTSENGTGACCAILSIFVTPGSFRKWNRRGFACFPWYKFGVLDSLSMVARIIWVPGNTIPVSMRRVKATITPNRTGQDPLHRRLDLANDVIG